jgi:hypothetical protein
MIGIKLDKSKFLFDKQGKQRIFAGVDKVQARNLSKNGGMIRTTARRSMRRRKKASAPGTPPSAHTKSPQFPRGPLLKDRLFFQYDSGTRSVVVGPEKLGGSRAPGVLETGGMVRTVRIVRKAGKPLSPKALAAFKRKRDAGTLPPRKKPQTVTGMARVAARPFMSPALKQNEPRLAGVWANTVK